VWISEQTAIISLYNINWLVFITQTQCVYCAVRTGCLNVIQAIINLYNVTVCTLISSFSPRILIAHSLNQPYVCLFALFFTSLSLANTKHRSVPIKKSTNPASNNQPTPHLQHNTTLYCYSKATHFALNTAISG